jgi:lycopene cyclase domain-containing protein
MPETNNERQPQKKFSPSQASYLISILVAFLGPILFLFKKVGGDTSKKSLAVSTLIIGALGWGWSWLVSSSGWWTFGEKYLLGIQVIPHLPIEEVLFYPLGGLLCILFYLMGSRWADVKNAAAYWAFLIIGTGVFATLAWITREHKPYYVTSQLVLYNTLCSIFLAPFVARRINLLGLAVPIAILSVVGFAWNYIGFKYGWWAYHATMHINIDVVPIDDFNFFLFAPTAAISIFLAVRKFTDPPPGGN